MGIQLGSTWNYWWYAGRVMVQHLHLPVQVSFLLTSVKYMTVSGCHWIVNIFFLNFLYNNSLYLISLKSVTWQWCYLKKKNYIKGDCMLINIIDIILHQYQYITRNIKWTNINWANVVLILCMCFVTGWWLPVGCGWRSQWTCDISLGY